MAATRTALGTASAKASGTTLTTSSVNPPVGSMIIVGVGYDSSQGHPASVEWNGRLLKRRLAQLNVAGSFGFSLWAKNRVHNDVTASAVVTWAGSINTRAMFVTALEGVQLVDEKSSNSHEAGIQTPTTGAATPALDFSDDFALAAFVSGGPSSDAAGTGQILDGGSFTGATAGQRAGTAGGGALTNVTIAEWYLQLTATDGTRARINGDATSRRWATGIVALERDTYYSQGITPTDVQEGERLFAEEIPPADPAGMMFFYNEDKDQWEVHEVTASTLIAMRSKSDPSSWT